MFVFVYADVFIFLGKIRILPKILMTLTQILLVSFLQMNLSWS